MQRIGIISDTHGRTHPAAYDALKGVVSIIHAGDIGSQKVLDLLNEIAPVTAVRGNMDGGDYVLSIKNTEVVEVENALLYVLHDVHRLDLDPAAAGFNAVIFGHSHRPEKYEKNGVLFLNPGSAGPKRFSLPVSLAILTVNAGDLKTEFIDLEN